MGIDQVSNSQISMENISLSKDTFFYSLGNWGRRLVGFAVAPITIAYFTPADFGYMSLVNLMASFCSTLGLLAIVDQGLPRFFLDTKDEVKKKGYMTTSLFISGAGVLFMTFIILSSTTLVPGFFKDVNVSIIFTSLIALTCLAQSFQRVGNSMLKWTFQSPLFAKITVVQAMLGAGLSIGGIVLLGWRAKEVLLVGGLVLLGAGVWANLSVRRYIRLSAVSKKKLKELVAYSWPLLGLNIFAFFMRSLDRIFLASLASLSAAGVLSVSYTIASLFGTLVSGFFLAWGPYMLSTFRETWAPQRYAQFFSVISCLGIMSIVTLGLWGSPIVMLFRPDGAYQEIGVFIPWVLSGTLLYYLGGYFAPGPSITKKTHWNLIAFVLAGTCNGILNYTLIPRLGILGAGIATSVSTLIAGIFNQVVSNRLYYVPNRWKFSFATILAFTIVVSFSQHAEFIYNINDMAFLSRIMFTVTLMTLGILPFFKDVRRSGILQRFIGKILKT